jgi:putative FmdB family regulatory protein
MQGSAMTKAMGHLPLSHPRYASAKKIQVGDESRAVRFESGAAEVYNFLLFGFPQGGNMPHYEFFCHDCMKLFSKVLSFVDYAEGEVVCPRCGSRNIEQRWSAFTAITSRKSA